MWPPVFGDMCLCLCPLLSPYYNIASWLVIPLVSSAASYRSAVATVDGSSFESASSVYNLDASLAASAKASAGTSSSVDEGVEFTGKIQKKVPLQSLSKSRSSSSASSTDTYSNINLPLPPPPPLSSHTMTMALPSALSINTGTPKEQPLRTKGSPSRTNVVTPIMAKQVAMWPSVSEDEEGG